MLTEIKLYLIGRYGLGILLRVRDKMINKKVVFFGGI